MHTQLSHLKDLNLWFLLSLRDAALKDIHVACAEYGADPEFAQLVVDLPINQIQNIATTEKVLFKPSINADALATLALLPAEARRAFATIASH